MSADVVRQSAAARHGLRPVLHHVPRDLPRGACSAAGRSATHSETPREAFPGTRGRVATAQRRLADHRGRRACDRCRVGQWRADCSEESPLFGGPGRDAAAVRRRVAPRASCGGRALLHRVGDGARSETSATWTRPHDRLLQRLGNISLGKAGGRPVRSPDRSRLFAQQLSLSRSC